MSQDAPGMVELKNGAMAPSGAVLTSLLALEILSTEDYLTFFDLVTLAREPGYRGDPTSLARLQVLALLQSNNQLHDVTRNVILSAVSGDGLRMTISDPRKTA